MQNEIIEYHKLTFPAAKQKLFAVDVLNKPTLSFEGLDYFNEVAEVGFKMQPQDYKPREPSFR